MRRVLIGALIALTVGYGAADSAKAETEPPLAWAGLRGARISLELHAPFSSGSTAEGLSLLSQARTRWLGQKLFHNARPLLPASYRKFSRLSEWEIRPVDAAVQISHLGELTIKDVVVGEGGAERFGATYFLVEALTTGDELLSVHVGGGLLGGALYFTTDDLEQFSKWSRPIQVAVREGRLLLGMSRAQVVMSLGVPHRRMRISDERGVSDEWCWPHVTVSLSTGKVT